MIAAIAQSVSPKKKAGKGKGRGKGKDKGDVKKCNVCNEFLPLSCFSAAGKMSATKTTEPASRFRGSCEKRGR